MSELTQEQLDQKLGHYCLPDPLASLLNAVVGGTFDTDPCAHPEYQIIQARQLIVGNDALGIDGYYDEWGKTVLVNPPGLSRPPMTGEGKARRVIQPNYPLHSLAKWVEMCQKNFESGMCDTIIVHCQSRTGAVWFEEAKECATCHLTVKSRVKNLIPTRDADGVRTGVREMKDPRSGSEFLVWTRDSCHYNNLVGLSRDVWNVYVGADKVAKLVKKSLEMPKAEFTPASL